ncbi:MAG: hypothetical protein WD314_07950 [Trueperaceae bacterium]
MLLLPAQLREALRHAPRVVVAPVAVGFGQAALRAWAEGTGRTVLHDPGALAERPALLICARRSQLARIPRALPLSELLVIDESDTVFDAAGWRDAMDGLPANFSDETFEECRGWPLGLELAQRIGDCPTPLHRHPLAAVALERLLPEGRLRETLGRAAITPLLVPDHYLPLSIEPAEVDELLNKGYLRPERDGLSLPRLLRRYLRQLPVAPHSESTAGEAGPAEKELTLAVARTLADRRHLDEALTALAEAELWEAYLELLAQGYEPTASDGEARLRRSLRVLPAWTHGTGEYRYLVGSLERLRGELERAQAQYRSARTLAAGELRARIDNARGIAYALRGKLEDARKAFGAAAKGAGGKRGAPSAARLEGEARHNRAGVFIQQGHFAQAETDLRLAVGSFRDAADYVREARSLQLLALSWHRRGLLQEARTGYGEALELLATLGQPTALLRVNLAEVLLLTGNADEAKNQLELAAGEALHDARASGYVQVNLAFWRLSQGQTEAAGRQLRELLRQEGLEAHLHAEARLLLARALRLQGEREEALEHARSAGPVGVAAMVEEALCRAGDRGPSLDDAIALARTQEARFELATALLHRGASGDLEESLALIRAHGYRILLDSPQHAPALAALAQNDPATVELFPLRMSTFGGFTVRFLGHALTLAEFPTRKSAALLLRLALARRPLARETLAEEFWSDTSNPVHSLQTALYHLNRTLSAQVVGGRKGTVELIYPVALDLAEFEQAATRSLEGSAPENAWAHDAEGVRLALAIAAGEPLAEFPEWFDEERRRAEALRLRLWRRLAELDSSEPRRAAESLEALLRLDPYDVESHRNLIGIYAELGEANLVRRQRERLRLLESEL